MVLREPDVWATFDRRDVERLPVLLGEGGGFHSIWANEREVRLGDVTFDQLGDGRRLFFRVAAETELLGGLRDVVRSLGFPQPVERRLPRAAADTTVAADASATGIHTRVQRYFGDIPVHGAEYTVHWHPERGVYAVTGTPATITDVLGTSALQMRAEPVVTAFREQFGVEELLQARVRPVILPVGELGIACQECLASVPHSGADVVAYFAEDLRLLASWTVSSAAAGRGSSYPVNPLRSPSVMEVDLNDLTAAGERLRGVNVEIHTGMPPPASSPTADYRYDPSDRHFDEASAYYYLWRCRWEVSKLCPSSILGRGALQLVKATVRDPSVPDNAVYSPLRGQLLFGDFDGGSRPSSRSSDVVAHEFGHIVSDVVCELGRGSPHSEARGLSEGYSDYLSAALHDDPRLGDYVVDRPEGARDCSDPSLRFPPGFAGEEHATGSVWAAVMWDIRQRIDKTAADRLAFEALFFLDERSGFMDGRNALITADRQLHPDPTGRGQNEAVIQTAFDARLDA
jgi:hypothetical protein